MMKAFFVGVAALGVLVLTGGQSEARRLIHPWCEVSSADGIWHCDFATFEQCRQFAVGDGVCENNPWYVSPPLVRAAPHRARKKPRHR
jgi:hypothetical protein